MSDLAETEAGIRQLQAHYIDAVWRKDYTAFADCFTLNGRWCIAGLVLEGPTECTDFLKEAMTRFDRVRMTMDVPILQTGTGEAIGRTAVFEHNILVDRSRNITIGTYYDRFVEEEGRWRFDFHYYELYYLGPPDMSGDFYKVRDFGPPFAMPKVDDMTASLAIARGTEMTGRNHLR